GPIASPTFGPTPRPSSSSSPTRSPSDAPQISSLYAPADPSPGFAADLLPWTDDSVASEADQGRIPSFDVAEGPSEGQSDSTTAPTAAPTGSPIEPSIVPPKDSELSEGGVAVGPGSPPPTVPPPPSRPSASNDPPGSSSEPPAESSAAHAAASVRPPASTGGASEVELVGAAELASSDDGVLEVVGVACGAAAAFLILAVAFFLFASRRRRRRRAEQANLRDFCMAPPSRGASRVCRTTDPDFYGDVASGGKAEDPDELLEGGGIGILLLPPPPPSSAHLTPRTDLSSADHSPTRSTASGSSPPYGDGRDRCEGVVRRASASTPERSRNKPGTPPREAASAGKASRTSVILDIADQGQLQSSYIIRLSRDSGHSGNSAVTPSPPRARARPPSSRLLDIADHESSGPSHTIKLSRDSSHSRNSTSPPRPQATAPPALPLASSTLARESEMETIRALECEVKTLSQAAKAYPKNSQTWEFLSSYLERAREELEALRHDAGYDLDSAGDTSGYDSEGDSGFQDSASLSLDYERMFSSSSATVNSKDEKTRLPMSFSHGDSGFSFASGKSGGSLPPTQLPTTLSPAASEVVAKADEDKLHAIERELEAIAMVMKKIPPSSPVMPKLRTKLEQVQEEWDAIQADMGLQPRAIDVVAPSGKLGMIVDKRPDGGPVYVRMLHRLSPLRGRIQVDDEIVAIDDEDVQHLSAVEVGERLSLSRNNSRTKISVVRDPKRTATSSRRHVTFQNQVNVRTYVELENGKTVAPKDLEKYERRLFDEASDDGNCIDEVEETESPQSWNRPQSLGASMAPCASSIEAPLPQDNPSLLSNSKRSMEEVDKETVEPITKGVLETKAEVADSTSPEMSKGSGRYQAGKSGHQRERLKTVEEDAQMWFDEYTRRNSDGIPSRITIIQDDESVSSCDTYNRDTSLERPSGKTKGSGALETVNGNAEDLARQETESNNHLHGPVMDDNAYEKLASSPTPSERTPGKANESAGGLTWQTSKSENLHGTDGPERVNADDEARQVTDSEILDGMVTDGNPLETQTNSPSLERTVQKAEERGNSERVNADNMARQDSESDDPHGTGAPEMVNAQEMVNENADGMAQETESDNPHISVSHVDVLETLMIPPTYLERTVQQTKETRALERVTAGDIAWRASEADDPRGTMTECNALETLANSLTPFTPSTTLRDHTSCEKAVVEIGSATNSAFASMPKLSDHKVPEETDQIGGSLEVREGSLEVSATTKAKSAPLSFADELARRTKRIDSPTEAVLDTGSTEKLAHSQTLLQASSLAPYKPAEVLISEMEAGLEDRSPEIVSTAKHVDPQLEISRIHKEEEERLEKRRGAVDEEVESWYAKNYGATGNETEREHQAKSQSTDVKESPNEPPPLSNLHAKTPDITMPGHDTLVELSKSASNANISEGINDFASMLARRAAEVKDPSTSQLLSVQKKKLTPTLSPRLQRSTESTQDYHSDFSSTGYW
ncbi:hypothetical protein ACHAWF_016505, partial [Thalassiosira exigua]